MTYRAELSNDAYIMCGDYARSVGWISSAHPFATGNVTPDAVWRLKEFAQGDLDCEDAFGWPLAMSWSETCELCLREEGRIFAVPAGALLYVAPSIIVHYVEAHRYLPPTEFIAALFASSLPGTEDYRCAVAPFVNLYREQLRAQANEEEERRLDKAAEWVISHGGDENTLQAWKRLFFPEGLDNLLLRDVPKEKYRPQSALIECLDRLEKQYLDRIRRKAGILKENA